MKKIEIEYPVSTYDTLIIDIDELINMGIEELKSDGVESINDFLLDEFGNNMGYYLEKYGLNEFDYEESAWNIIVDRTYSEIEDRLNELEELPL